MSLAHQMASEKKTDMGPSLRWGDVKIFHYSSD